MEEVKKYLRLILNVVIPLIGLYLVCFWGPKVVGFFMPFVIGWIIALIANPLVRFLERRLNLVRRHSSALIIIIVLGLVIFLMYLLISGLYGELSGFLKHLPQLVENAAGDVSGALQNSQHLFDFLPDGIQAHLEQFSDNLDHYLGELVSKAAMPTVEIAGNVAKGIPNALVNTVITIFSSYLFIAEQDRMVMWLKQYTPPFVLRYGAFLKKDARELIGGYFMAQFRIMFVVGAILAVGFFVLGVSYGPVLAALIAFLDFLPVFGTGTALIPWAVVKLFTGSYSYAFGLLALYVITQVVRQMIQPKIVGDTMGLPPLMTLFLLYMGFKIRGIAGMILAVPIGLVFINFYKYGAFDSMADNGKLLIREVNVLRGKNQESWRRGRKDGEWRTGEGKTGEGKGKGQRPGEQRTGEGKGKGQRTGERKNSEQMGSGQKGSEQKGSGQRDGGRKDRE